MPSSVGRKPSNEDITGEGRRPTSAPPTDIPPSGRPMERSSQNWHAKNILATWASTYPPKPGASQSSLQPYQNSIGAAQYSPKSKPTLPASGSGFNPGFENHVRRAIRQHKVFSVHPNFPAIRRALINRGWVEKARGYNATISNANKSSIAEIAKRADYESEDAWVLRGLRDYPADFVWVFLGDYVNWNSLLPSQLVSWHPSSPFTSKVGICTCLQQSHWVSEFGTANINFPRCYRLGVEEERTAFTNDFKLTACLGLLKWVIGAYEREGERGVVDPSSRTLPVCVDFAVRQVSHYARVRKHEDIDWISPPSVTAYQWEIFLGQYTSVVVNKGKLAIGEPESSARHMYEASLKALQRVAPFWPQLLAEGVTNVWICKPAARNRGIGIVLMNNLENILGRLMSSRDGNWVVQKYIERPMLIYKTKFDIRQWFVVTDWSPLTVWFYKESYLRFCSKPFSLDDFDESIHLCNNAVQVKYKNAENRDSALPEENMWDNYTFVAYLRTIGKHDLWDKVIYPSMKQAILCVLLSCQEEVAMRKNSFELYGADFMISDNFTPWLIEINSCPCMAPTTSVTSRMCNQCLFDLIKVVVDRRTNPSASTGLFELIYKQSTLPPFNYFPSSDMAILGRKLGRDVDWPSVVTKCQTKKGDGVKSEDGGQLLPLDRQKTGSSDSIDSQHLTFQELVTRLRFKDAQAKTPIEYKTPAVVETPAPSVPSVAPSTTDDRPTTDPPTPSKSTSSQTKKGSLSKNSGKSKARRSTSKENNRDKEGKKNVQFNGEHKQQESEKRSETIGEEKSASSKPSSTNSDNTMNRAKRRKGNSESPAKKRAKSSDPEISHKSVEEPPPVSEVTVASSKSNVNHHSRPSAALAAAKLSLTLDHGTVKPFLSTTYKTTLAAKAQRGASNSENNSDTKETDKPSQSAPAQATSGSGSVDHHSNEQKSSPVHFTVKDSTNRSNGSQRKSSLLHSTVKDTTNRSNGSERKSSLLHSTVKDSTNRSSDSQRKSSLLYSTVKDSTDRRSDSERKSSLLHSTVKDSITRSSDNERKSSLLHSTVKDSTNRSSDSERKSSLLHSTVKDSTDRRSDSEQKSSLLYSTVKDMTKPENQAPLNTVNAMATARFSKTNRSSLLATNISSAPSRARRGTGLSSYPVTRFQRPKPVPNPPPVPPVLAPAPEPPKPPEDPDSLATRTMSAGYRRIEHSATTSASRAKHPRSRPSLPSSITTRPNSRFSQNSKYLSPTVVPLSKIAAANSSKPDSDSAQNYISQNHISDTGSKSDEKDRTEIVKSDNT